LLDLFVFQISTGCAQVTTLPAMEETSLIIAASVTQEAKVEEIGIPKVQGVATLVRLLENEEKEDEEHITPVTSLFFSNFDEDEYDKEEDTATTALAVKDVVLLAVVEGRSMSLKAELMPPMTTPLAMIMVEEKTSSTKATIA
jgi:hypothetical protein